MTSTTGQATATDIATYNTFVQTRAKAGHTAITDSCGNKFKVVGSTSTVDARANVDAESSDTDAAIYWLNGAKAADDYADFWDGSWDSYSGKNESGTANSPLNVWTGSNSNGTKHSTEHFKNTGNKRAGSPRSGNDPISHSSASGFVGYPFYALSPLFKVAGGPPQVTISGGSAVTEGTAARFTLTMTPAPTSRMLVNVTVADAPNADFVSSTNQGSQTILFPMGVSTSISTVATQTDSTDEPSGPVTMTVKAGTGYEVGSTSSATVTVNDDDATSVTLTGNADAVSEGSTKTFTLAIGRALRAGEKLAIPLTINSGSGAAGRNTDYTLACPGTLPTGVTCNNLNTATTPTVTITGSAAGSATSVTLTLSATTDSVTEASGETVNIGIGTITATGLGGGAGTPADNAPAFKINDPGKEVTIAAAASATEGSALTFTVSLDTAAPSGGVTVTYTTAGGRGMSSDPTYKVATGSSTGVGADYTTPSGSVTIAQGSMTGTITVNTTNDNTYESDHYLTVTLSAATNSYTVDASNSKGIGTITDAADKPTVGFTQPSYSGQEEAGTATFTLNKSGTTLVPTTVTWSTRDNTAVAGSDYTAVSGATVTFQPNETSKDIEVTLLNDDIFENSNETLQIRITTDEHASTGGAFAGFTILDDADRPLISIARDAASVTEGAPASFTLRASKERAVPLDHIAVVGQAGAEEMNQERLRRVAGYCHGCRHAAVSFVPMREIDGRTPSPDIRPPPRSRPSLSSRWRTARGWRRLWDGGAPHGCRQRRRRHKGRWSG